MSACFSTKSFRLLKCEWYERLKLAGFEDIENEKGQLRPEVHHETMTRALKEMEIRIEYRAQALDFLHSYKFESKTDETLWELHCDGARLNQMGSVLGLTMMQTRWRLNKLKVLSGLKK